MTTFFRFIRRLFCRHVWRQEVDRWWSYHDDAHNLIKVDCRSFKCRKCGHRRLEEYSRGVITEPLAATPEAWKERDR